jgi:hypothetical protein
LKLLGAVGATQSNEKAVVKLMFFRKILEFGAIASLPLLCGDHSHINRSPFKFCEQVVTITYRFDIMDIEAKSE